MKVFAKMRIVAGGLAVFATVGVTSLGVTSTAFAQGSPASQSSSLTPIALNGGTLGNNNRDGGKCYAPDPDDDCRCFSNGNGKDSRNFNGNGAAVSATANGKDSPQLQRQRLPLLQQRERQGLPNFNGNGCRCFSNGNGKDSPNVRDNGCGSKGSGNGDNDADNGNGNGKGDNDADNGNGNHNGATVSGGSTGSNGGPNSPSSDPASGGSTTPPTGSNGGVTDLPTGVSFSASSGAGVSTASPQHLAPQRSLCLRRLRRLAALPFTGADITRLVGVGASAMAIGGIFMLSSRRRRSHTAWRK